MRCRWKVSIPPGHAKTSSSLTGAPGVVYRRHRGPHACSVNRTSQVSSLLKGAAVPLHEPSMSLKVDVTQGLTRGQCHSRSQSLRVIHGQYHSMLLFKVDIAQGMSLKDHPKSRSLEVTQGQHHTRSPKIKVTQCHTGHLMSPKIKVTQCHPKVP